MSQRRPGENCRPHTLQLAPLTSSALPSWDMCSFPKPALEGQRLLSYRGQERAAGVCPEPLAVLSDGNLTACVSAVLGTDSSVCAHLACSIQQLRLGTFLSTRWSLVIKRSYLLCFQYNDKITKECTTKELLTRNGTHGLKSHTRAEH